MAEGEERVDITDISNSPAFVALNELLNDGTLTAAQVEFYKSKYAKLHEVVLQTYENEKNLLRKAKDLNEDLRKEKLAAEDIGGRDKEVREELEQTRTEFAKAEAEVVLCEEREAMLMLEMAELDRQKEEITKEKEEKEREAMEALRPRIEALNLHIEQLQAEIATATDQSQKSIVEKNELHEKATKLAQEIATLQIEVDEERQRLMKVRGEPGKVKKQVDVSESSLNALNAELQVAQAGILAVDKTLKEQSLRRKTIEEDRDELSLLRSRHHDSIEQKMRIKQEQERDLHEQLRRRDQIQEEALQQDVDMRGLMLELKRSHEAHHRTIREKEDEIKAFRKGEAALSVLQGMLPNLKFQGDDCRKTLQMQQREKRDQFKRLEELNRDIDIFINDFLQEESLEKDKAAALSTLLKENKELEEELSLLSQQTLSLDREAFDLSARRDAKAREYAKAVHNRRDADEEMKVKDIVILDLSKRSFNLAQQLREYTKLYEVVKNERNKAVNMIQTSQQAAAEMKEKIGILQNEIEILQNESTAKDKALTVEHSLSTKSVVERDSVRSEVNKLLFVYKEKQQLVDQKIAEIDKLNSIINVVERDMVRLKKQYEQAVEERNYTGIQLIDRNDELCILYEKCNIQEQILRNGELELNKREEEMRVLRLELSRFEWLYGVTTKLLPELPKYKTEIDRLKLQLEEEKKRSEQLSYELETPSNLARYRLLKGKDLSMPEMLAKVAQLEDRLNLKKEQLLEKELVLEEVGSLSERLRTQAVEGREETLDIAKTVNEYQAKIKRITRRLMACVSELSMYQATSIKLEQEKADKIEMLDVAKERLEAGEAPTEDAEREWDRMQRRRDIRSEMIMRRQDEERQATTDFETTAVPRPNAYMPEDIALPRPYGAMAPFKPTEPGATMRHITKPQPREIEI
uniref:Cilia- and flagella-associated protein 58 central coiled coil domain-containing protein n=1 Tax=Hemiselmis andersenii TaxID=464988 RepID=A0A6U2FXG2_HEMAN|mmetsp:Transcript_3392/g.7826  ORF Transcript_3392/g.7826 Transcript_3392/m.7826 type:complete len:922 (+) Transcript_3392:100-2865(+)